MPRLMAKLIELVFVGANAINPATDLCILHPDQGVIFVEFMLHAYLPETEGTSFRQFAPCKSPGLKAFSLSLAEVDLPSPSDT